MSYSGLLRSAIHDRLLADTGTGGLFESGSELVDSVYFEDAGENPSMPFLVLGFEEDASAIDDARLVRMSLDVHIFTERASASYVGLVRAEKIGWRVMGNWRDNANRIPDYGLERWQPTIAGFGVTPFAYGGMFGAHQPEVLHQILRFSAQLTEEA